MDSKVASEKLAAFFSIGKEWQYDKRAVILNYAEETDKAFWIADGSVMIVTCNKDGNERIQHIYGKGEVFPLQWIFSNDIFDIAFFAFTKAIVLTRPISDFRNFLTAEPLAMLPIVHQQIMVMESFLNMSLDSVEQRIASRLMSLARRYGIPQDCGAVRCPLSFQELASTARASREITGKILNKFERQGMVLLERRMLTVYPEKLKSFIEYN